MNYRSASAPQPATLLPSRFLAMLLGPDGSQFPWVELALVVAVFLVCRTAVRLANDYLEKRS